MEKKCFKCLQIKDLTDYYKHSKMADGHLGKCKECTRKDVSERLCVKMKDPLFVQEERRRSRGKNIRIRRIKKDPTTPPEVSLRYRARYPEKYLAAKAARKIEKIVGHHLHHWSYNEIHWLDLIVLKSQDHPLVHAYMTYDQERMMYRVSCNLEGFEFGELLYTRHIHEKFIESCIAKFKDTHARPLIYKGKQK